MRSSGHVVPSLFLFLPCGPKKKEKKREEEGERGKKEGGTDQNTRISGAPPIPSTRLPIQTGVSALTAAGGDGFGSLCGPLFV